MSAAATPSAGLPFRAVLSWSERGRAEVTVHGELDRDTVSLLARAVDEALELGGQDVVVDVRGLMFCDAGGLNYLVGARNRATAQGRCLRVVGASAALVRLVTVLHLEQLLG